MNKFLPNKNKIINWPNSPDLVKKPNRLIPKFEKYYPSISDIKEQVTVLCSHLLS